MAIESASLSVGNVTPVELTSPGQAQETSGAWSRLVVKAPAAEALFVGPAGVTTTTGYSIAAGAEFAVELAPGEQVFGIIAGAAAQTVRVFRARV